MKFKSKLPVAVIEYSQFIGIFSSCVFSHLINIFQSWNIPSSMIFLNIEYSKFNGNSSLLNFQRLNIPNS